jgi:hypothetical protein
MGWYDTAQVCESGHVTNEATKERPAHSQKFCDKCGARTLTQCPGCKGDIRGEYHSEVVVIGPTIPAPSFCHGCGTAYPWMQSRLMAARELAMELTVLTPEGARAVGREP